MDNGFMAALFQQEVAKLAPLVEAIKKLTAELIALGAEHQPTEKQGHIPVTSAKFKMKDHLFSVYAMEHRKGTFEMMMWDSRTKTFADATRQEFSGQDAAKDIFAVITKSA